jgi:putative aldouronate transport system permease protein
MEDMYMPYPAGRPPRVEIHAKTGLKTRLWQQKYLLMMILPGFLLVFIFNYMPMYGVLMAFEDYSFSKGIIGSKWVGFKHFITFLGNPMAFRVVKNTLVLGVYSLLWSFPAPIAFALLLNEIKAARFKKLIQTVSYFPYFISTVIVAGMLLEFCARDGMFNQLRMVIGLNPITFLLDPKYFRTIFIASGIWQTTGYGTIIYLAAISNIDPALYDVASLDGANRFQKMHHITLPAMMPTVTILLIFAISGILGSDFQKIMLLYTPQTYPVADVIGTYTYREGIVGAKFEYTTAIGLFNSVVSFVLLTIANFISKRASETSLW